MEELDYRKIGDRIRAARKALNLTQEEASERCDITSSFYGSVERGDKRMSVDTLVKISKGLKISTDVLLDTDIKKQEVLIEFLQEIQQNTDEKQFEKIIMLMRAISTIADQL